MDRALHEEALLVILGSVIVDVERPFSLLLTYFGYTWHDLTAGFHSILGIVVISWAAATAFEIDRVEFGTRFKMILLGTVVHLLLDFFMLYFYGIELFTNSVAIIPEFQSSISIFMGIGLLVGLMYYQVVLVPIFVKVLISGFTIVRNLGRTFKNRLFEIGVLAAIMGEIFLIYSAIVVWNNFLQLISWTVWYFSFLVGIRHFLELKTLDERRRLLGFVGFLAIFSSYFCASLVSDYLISRGALDNFLGKAIIRHRIMEYISIPLSLFSSVGIKNICRLWQTSTYFQYIHY